MDIIVAIEITDLGSAAADVVISAAAQMFGSADPVEVLYHLSGVDEPTEEQAQRLETAILSGIPVSGALPPVRLSGHARALATHCAVRFRATADVAESARSVALLTSFAGALWDEPAATGAPKATLAHDKVRRARDRRRREDGGRPLHAVVVVQHPNTWGALAPIAAAAAAHHRVEVNVVALESALSRNDQEVSHFVRAEGYEPRDETWFQNNLDTVDVVVLADPYDEFRPATFHVDALAARGIRLVYSAYAENIGGGRDSLARQYDAPLHNLAWRSFLPSREQVTLYAEHCTAGGAATRCLGPVKADWLLGTAPDQGAMTTLRAAIGDRPTVLWNPHFTHGPGGLSTFLTYAHEFLGHFGQHADHFLIARPHFRLLADLDRSGDQARRLADDFRRACGRLANVHLDESRDYRAAMLSADVLVSDLSSLIPEFLELGRPVYYLERPDAAPTVSDGTWRSKVTTVRSAAELRAALESTTRDAETTVGSTARGAGQRVVDVLVGDFVQEVWGR
ncbi:hypothetical protein [Kineococcus sp. NUM-3379]